MEILGGARPGRRAGLAVLAVLLLVILLLVTVLTLVRSTSDDADRDRPEGGGTTVTAGSEEPADPTEVVRNLSASSFGDHQGGPLIGMNAAYDQRTGANRKQWTWPLHRALNVWGMGTLSAQAPDRIDAVLRVQRPALYFLHDGGSWERIPESQPGAPSLWTSVVTFPDGRWTQGASFPWAHDAATDTWTIDLSQFPKGTYAHWAWNSYVPRVEVPDDVVAVATVGYARLEGPNADAGSWLMGLSSDTFTGPTGTGSQHNVALQGPRYRAATSSWQLFGVTTQSADELQADPPPVPAP